MLRDPELAKLGKTGFLQLSYLGASDAVGIAVTDDRHNHSADDALERQ